VPRYGEAGRRRAPLMIPDFSTLDTLDSSSIWIARARESSRVFRPKDRTAARFVQTEIITADVAVVRDRCGT
jgi:hypothetical protein